MGLSYSNARAAQVRAAARRRRLAQAAAEGVDTSDRAAVRAWEDRFWAGLKARFSGEGKPDALD